MKTSSKAIQAGNNICTEDHTPPLRADFAANSAPRVNKTECQPVKSEEENWFEGAD